MKGVTCHPERKLYARGLCSACYARWHRSNNPKYAERQREGTRKWYRENLEQARLSASVEERVKRDPDYRRKRDATEHRDNLWTKYRIRVEQYDALLIKQNGLCAVCAESELGRGKCLSVDHDHTTGLVRGLLCRRCNTALGMLRESEEIMLSLHRYIKAAEAQNACNACLPDAFTSCA